MVKRSITNSGSSQSSDETTETESPNGSTPSQSPFLKLQEEDASGLLFPGSDEISKFAKRLVEVKTKSKIKESKTLKSSEAVIKSLLSALPKLDEPEMGEDDDSDQTEDLVVLETVADKQKEFDVIRAKLNRMGFRYKLWKGTIGSYFVFAAFIGGYDSMTTFTYYVSQYGMGFVLIYLLSLIFFGLPLTYMEMALGQYTSSGAVAVYSRIAPAFVGLGYVAMALNLLYFVTDQFHIAYFMDLFFNTLNFFVNEMPWHRCENKYNDINCRDVTHSCEYLEQKGLELSEELTEMLQYSPIGSICYRSQSQFASKDAVGNWSLRNIGYYPLNEWMAAESMGQHLFWNVNIFDDRIQFKMIPSFSYLIYYLLALIAILVICHLGNKAITFVATASGIVAVATLGSMFIWMVFLSPPPYPYHHYLQQRLSDNFKTGSTTMKLVSSAVLVTLTTLRLGQGGLIYFGSQHSFSNSLVTNSIIYTSTAGLTLFIYSFLHFFGIHSYTLGLVDGNMKEWRVLAANVLSPEKSYFYAAGSRLIHMAFFLQSLRAWTASEPLLICLFSGMAILMTLANKIVRAEIIISGLFETIPILCMTYGVYSRILLMFGFFCGTYLLMFLFMTITGLDILVGIENLTQPAVTALIVLFELIVVGWCYGGRRLMTNAMAMGSHKRRTKVKHQLPFISLFVALSMTWIWKFFTPILILMCIVMKIIIGRTGAHGFRTKLIKLTDVNVVLMVLALAVIVGCAVKKILQSRREKLAFRSNFQPDPDLWGARAADDIYFAEKLEMKLRVR